MSMAELLQFLQAGGSAALLVAVFFIHRAAERLTRIERMLEVILLERGVDPHQAAPKKGTASGVIRRLS